MLDVPVPLEEQLLVDAFAPHDILVPEQVIEVPKILVDELSVRTPVRESQLAEQLVEVPTITSYSSLSQRTMEQNVDFPVPDRTGRNSGLQGFLLGQSSTSSSFSLERISERIVAQNVEFPVGGGLQGFRPRQSSSASSSSTAGFHGSADEPGEGSFSHFSPNEKKCEDRSALGVGTECGLYFIHASMRSPISLKTASSIMRMIRRYG